MTYDQTTIDIDEDDKESTDKLNALIEAGLAMVLPQRNVRHMHVSSKCLSSIHGLAYDSDSGGEEPNDDTPKVDDDVNEREVAMDCIRKKKKKMHARSDDTSESNGDNN
jgi:hypothetical protein